VATTPEEAQRELAKRELERRQVPQPSQPPISIFGGFPDVGRAAIGLGEGALNIGTGALGSIVGGVAAAPVAFTDIEVANKILNKVSGALTFQPRTQAGEAAAELFRSPFEALEKGADVTAEFLGAPGGPGLQTAIKTSLLAIPSILAPARNIRAGRLVAEKPLTLKQNVLKEAQAEGLVVPASDAVPSSVARGAVEGLAGKPRLNQDASFRNTQTINDIVAKELGLPKGAEVSLASLDALRREAGQAYSVLENAGTITPTVLFRRDLAGSIADLRKASRDFPVLAKADSPVAAVIEMAQGLNKPTFQASSAITAIKVLRDEAGAAFRAGQPKVGNAYRDISKALEDATQLHLENFGNPAAVQVFREARVRIAKSFSVEKALTGDGFVSAAKLAAQRSRRDPLTGGLDLIARFSEQFPQASRVIKTPPIQTGRLSSGIGLLGLTGATLAGSPLAAIPSLALAFGGPAVRGSILSRFGQATLAKPRPELTGVGAAELGVLESALLADANNQ